jgi:acyl carrier protein
LQIYNIADVYYKAINGSKLSKRRYLMERVLEIIQEQLNLTGVEITEDSSLKDDLGIDSIDMVELVMAFEDEYGIEVQYEELDKKVKTVGDIVDFLREQGADV